MLLFSAGCSGGTSKVSSQLNANKSLVNAQVVKVIDGDTIKVRYNGQEETVRFLLVDTPETHHPKLGVQPYGPEASAYTHRLLDGQTVQLELAVNGGRDKYGRILAYIFHDGKSVEEALLSKGLARVAYVIPPNTKYINDYYTVEKKAKAKKIGIWSVQGYARSDGFHPEVMKNSQGNQGPTLDKTTNTDGSFAPDASGGCTGAIKGNITRNGSKIYHLSTDRYYKVTKAEECFKTIKKAVSAGFRAPR